MNLIKPSKTIKFYIEKEVKVKSEALNVKLTLTPIFNKKQHVIDNDYCIPIEWKSKAHKGTWSGFHDDLNCFSLENKKS